jgi:hypothetical protein
MINKPLRVLFFITREGPDRDLEEYAAAAGVERLSPLPTYEESPLAGSWAGLGYVEVSSIVLSHHVCLVLTGSLRVFRELRAAHRSDAPVPLEEDGALPVARAFADACARLRPEVAMLFAHPELGTRQWVEDNYWMVLGMDANAMADLRAGMLYLSSRVADGWASAPWRDRRDSYPVDDGRIDFAGEGRARWF